MSVKDFPSFFEPSEPSLTDSLAIQTLHPCKSSQVHTRDLPEDKESTLVRFG